MTTTTAMARTGARTGTIYVWLAGACVAVAFSGFAASYWLQVGAGTTHSPPLLHLHGLVFTAWTLLLLWQTVQVALGQYAQHRAWGVAGVSLATAMVFLGMAVSIRQLNKYLGEGFGDAARAYMWLPVGSLALFTGFLAAAVACVHRPEWHKRLMIVATVSALQAAIGRIGFLTAAHGGAPGLRPGPAAPPAPENALIGAVLMSLILVAGAAYDWRTRGRPHAAYLLGIAVLLVCGLGGLTVSHTPPWFAAMDALAGFAG